MRSPNWFRGVSYSTSHSRSAIACVFLALSCGSKTLTSEPSVAGGGAASGGGGVVAGASHSEDPGGGSSAGSTAAVQCDAGDTRVCVGPGACTGGQFCGADERWSACNCGTGGSSAGGGASDGLDGGAGAGGGSSGEGNSAEGGSSPAAEPGPSCAGLAKTCGANQDDDCCASSVIPGGTFYRVYDGIDYKDKTYPATVSDFRLDTYEVTAARFYNFVDAYSQDMIPQGAGKNPNNPTDSGWDTAWNQYLKSDSKALNAALQCSKVYVAGAIARNCLSWFDAEAFCIWDGGRLPTEAEWNYAASGGAEQRQYPWGSAPPDSQHAVYKAQALARVGSVPAGNGKWGQADLAGNVLEWVQDTFRDPASPFPVPCVDCTDMTDLTTKVIRSSSFVDSFAARASSRRFLDTVVGRGHDTGARCARTP